jgi:antitoxin component YwqK of YwqJK toxin-antitoxin module
MISSFRPIPLSFLAILASFCFLMLSGCSSKKEEVITNYPSGELSRRHIEVNGKKEGVMTEYYKDGKIKGERLFKNDIQIGKSTFYYPSGKIKEVQYYDEGKITGGDTLFYETGQPEFLRTYTKGLLDGYLRKWAPDGTIIFEAKYRNDTLVEVKGEPIKRDTTLQNM